MQAGDIFGNELWCEMDQEANFGYKSYSQLMTNKNTSIKDASGFDKAVRNMSAGHVNQFGRGNAVLLNLSPQWYNAYRVEGFAAAARCEVFMQPIHQAGIAAGSRSETRATKSSATRLRIGKTETGPFCSSSWSQKLM